MINLHKFRQPLPHFQGVARKVEIRTEFGTRTETKVHGNPWWDNIRSVSESKSNNSQVLSFRLEVTDQQGNIVALKQVALRGEKILGALCDGDLVEVVGKETRYGIVQPQKIYNLTTYSEVSSEQSSEVIHGILYVIAVAIVAIPVLTFLHQIVYAFLGPSLATFAVLGGIGYTIHLIAAYK